MGNKKQQIEGQAIQWSKEKHQRASNDMQRSTKKAKY
jgi:hypothetical protein